MALYYRTIGNVNKTVDRTDSESICTMNDAAEAVVRVEASDDELEAIMDQFTDIRKRAKVIVVWTGDDAKFIAKHFR